MRYCRAGIMTVQAQAAVVRKPGGPWAIENVVIETPRPDEVLVRIVGTGLCHTDLVFAAGLTVMKAPAIFGHEGAGVVEQVGSDVTRVRPGDHVVLSFNSCGRCVRCEQGHPAYCTSFAQLNFGGCRVDGTSGVSAGGARASAHFFGQSSFATYALASERSVVPIDRDLPLELMGPLGCGVQTGAGSIMRALACPPGSSLLVQGGGAVGLSAVLGAVVQGCGTIIVAEPRPERRALALELGATHAIDPMDGDTIAAVRAIAPIGVDFAFDTTGIPAVLTATVRTLASAGTLGIVGVAAPVEATLAVPINQLVGAGLRVVGIIEGDVVPDRFIPEMIALYRAGRFPFDKLLSTYPLARINAAIADQHAGTCVKPILTP